ncbi:3854_t:CDS:2 [Cetraspora pellucida]|uniref:3854_t:CDS:1 n=1 Tax=Cetraspora pellucida TaxID=1433469 RepID=A0ACA9NPP7_9GLOM|nr:3854_t:CDS:2 [Cetraspora pellucida]
MVAHWEKTEVGRSKKKGKAKNISLTGMAASDIQEIGNLTQQIESHRKELYERDIAKLEQNPNLLYEGTIQLIFLAIGIDKIKIEIISKNGLDFKCKFVELEDQITFVPFSENIFRLFREIAVHQIKVIILGQDPYHLPEVADGLAFSTQKPNYIPASLKNIFLEFSRDLNCVSPTKGDLLPWVKEGVFLLNTALTVRNGQALSHMTKKIGEECQIGSEYSLASAHPSPYSAEHGFFGSCPFSQINKLLSELGKKPGNVCNILLLNFLPVSVTAAPVPISE